MQAGQLKDRVTIQAASHGAADAYGEQAQAWADVVTVWAEVETLAGLEAYRARQLSSEASVNVTMRYTTDMTSDKRLRFGARYLYPISVVPDVKKTSMQVLCREVMQ